MISQHIKIRSKGELVRSINQVKNIEFEVIEVLGTDQKREVISMLDKLIRKGAVSVIFVREK
jgi:hypothetical protein|tara:strand:+ start:751 stop:936 length:186 start_codon:yes stop_codon:yes gene_type:complete